MAACFCAGAGEAGEAGAETTTKESVRLVSDLLARSPPSPVSGGTLAPPTSMEHDSLESPILPPPASMSYRFRI